MTTRRAHATWQGALKDGEGRIELGSGAWAGPYSFRTRFEDEQGANPEELIGAAHAGCFAMAFAHALSQAGHRPERIEAQADVRLTQDADGGFTIDLVRLEAKGRTSEIDAGEFKRIAEQAKQSCPVSKALAGVKIEIDARLMD